MTSFSGVWVRMWSTPSLMVAQAVTGLPYCSSHCPNSALSSARGLSGVTVVKEAASGATVSITVGGEVYKTLPLDSDAVIEVVTGENGEYVNTVTVKDGRVFVSYANCPDGICEDHRPIKYRGESIACLPHRLAVTVEGGEEGDVDITVK